MTAMGRTQNVPASIRRRGLQSAVTAAVLYQIWAKHSNQAELLACIGFVRGCSITVQFRRDRQSNYLSVMMRDCMLICRWHYSIAIGVSSLSVVVPAALYLFYTWFTSRGVYDLHPGYTS